MSDDDDDVEGDADWSWFNMADGHESAVVAEERYNHHKVSFYIDLFESASGGKPTTRPCPTEQGRPTDGDSIAPSDQGYNTWEERSCDVTVVDDDGSRHSGHRHDSQGDAEPGDGVVSDAEDGITEASTLESILATFERHELSFRKHFPVPELPPEEPTSPPAVNQTSQYVGLDQLGNLVRIMTQLSQLRDENSHLRKRCDFLTNTKSLMKIQNEMVHVKSMRSKTKPHTRLMQYLSTPAHTLSKRDSSRSLVSPESSISGTAEPVVMRKAVKLHHRSQSMGSIDLLDIELEDATENHKEAEEKPAKERGMRSRENKKSKRFSKWYRMKKVFTGKPEPSHKPESSGTISAEQLMKVNRRQHTISGTSSRSDKSPKLRHTTSVDAVVLSPSDNSGLDTSRSVSQSTPSPQPPCSPCSFQSEPPMVLPGSADMLDDVSVAPSAEEAGATDSEVHSPHLTRCASIASLSSDEEAEAPELEDATLPTEELISDDGEEPATRYLSVTTSSEATRQSSTQSLHYSSTGDEKDAFFAARPLTPETGYSSVMEIPHDCETEHAEMLSSMYDDEFGVTDMTMSPDDESQCGDAQKNRRSAWYRVKEIIHTRRDSLKGKTAAWQDNLADSPIEGEISPESGSWADQKLGHYDAEDYSHEKSGSDGPTSPTSESPKLIRRYMSTKNRGRSPRMASPNRKRHSLKTSAELIYPAVSSKASQEYPAFLVNPNEEFCRKMAEWQSKKQKEGGFNADEESGKDSSIATNFSEDFIRKMEEWERIKGLAAGASWVKPRSSSQETSTCCSPDSATPSELCHTPAIDDIQEHLSESFTKTVAEWERLREIRVREAGSPPAEGSRIRSRMKDRSKSRDRDRSSRERDRSRHKYEKERQKIERKEQKIEKERLRLEKMKLKLDVTLETVSSGSEARSADGLSHDFRRKLKEWESFKGLKPESDTPVDNVRHTRSKSEKQNRDSPVEMPQGRERIQSDSSIQLPASLTDPARTKPEAVSTSEPSPEGVVDDSTSTEGSTLLTDNSVAENRMITALMARAAEKDEYVATLQAQLQQLTDRINLLNRQHADEIESYRRELWATSKLGRYTIESDLLARSLGDMRQGLLQLRQYGDSVASKKQHIEMKVKEDTHARNKIESILLEEIEKLQMALVHKTESGKCSHMFEQLYDYIRKAQKQLHDLKIGILERNQVIEEMQRHLLVQEVTNKLLEADNERWELELQFFKRQRKAAILKRWQTFTGRDMPTREDDTFEVSKRRKRRSQVVHSGKLIQPYLRRISHGNIDSLMLHFDLLDQLKKQISESNLESAGVSEGVQVDSETGGHITTSVSVQTVMTLCNCSYVPDARMLATVPVAYGAPGTQVVISRVTVEDIDREVFAEYAVCDTDTPNEAELEEEIVCDVQTRGEEETGSMDEKDATADDREDAEDENDEEFVQQAGDKQELLSGGRVEMVDVVVQTDMLEYAFQEEKLNSGDDHEEKDLAEETETVTRKATAELEIPLMDVGVEVKCLGETTVKTVAAAVSEIRAANSPQGEVCATPKIASSLSTLAENVAEKIGKLGKKKSGDAASDGSISLPLFNAGLMAAVPNQAILEKHTDTLVPHEVVLEESTSETAIESVLEERESHTQGGDADTLDSESKNRTVDKAVESAEGEMLPIGTDDPVVMSETLACHDTNAEAASSPAAESVPDAVEEGMLMPASEEVDTVDTASKPAVLRKSRIRSPHRANSEPHLVKFKHPKRPNLDELFCPDVQLPASPMLRSKYPRRTRLSDLAIRQRRPSTEKPAIVGSELVREPFCDVSEVRHRTSSDVSLMRPKSLQLMPTHSCDESSLEFVAIGPGKSRRPNLPVFEVVNEPQSDDHAVHRLAAPSLQKPKMSPVQRLKSAVELMAESARSRRHRSASTGRLGTTRNRHASPRNDDGSPHKSRRLSRKDAATHALSSQKDVNRLSLPAEHNLEAHHKSRESLTNEGQVEKMSEMFARDWESSLPLRGRRLQLRETPLEGTVAERTDIFKKRLSSSSSESSGADGSSLLQRCRGVSLDRHRRQETVDYADRLRLTLWTSSKSGAVSSLCKQAMSVNLPDTRGNVKKNCSSLPRPTRRSQHSEGAASPWGVSDGCPGPQADHKKAHKFLEGTWLQKPKRFFKVSKC